MRGRQREIRPQSTEEGERTPAAGLFPCTLLALKVEDGPSVKEHKEQGSRSWKKQENRFFPQNFQGKNGPANTLISAQCSGVWISDIQIHKTMNEWVLFEADSTGWGWGLETWF